MTKKISTLVFLVLAGSVALVGASPAFGQPTLAGSWLAVSTVDGSGQQDQVLESYEKDGTVIASGPSLALSGAHGAWEKTGPRTFTSTIIFFIYGPDGNIALRGKSTNIVEVSLDGQSYEGVFVGEAALLDGTVVAESSGTVQAQRINAGD